jgi:hypothetical protein
MAKLNEEIKEFVKKQPFTVIITIGEDDKPYPIVVGKNPGAQFVGDEKIVFCQWQQSVTERNIQRDPLVLILAVDHEQSKSYRIFGEGSYLEKDLLKSQYGVELPGFCKKGLVVEVKRIQYGQYGDKTNLWLD